MKYTDITGIVANRLNIPEDVVKAVYRAYWEFIKVTITELPLESVGSEEDLSRLRTSFNIKFLGKLHTDYKRVKYVNDRRKQCNGRFQEETGS